MAARAQALRGTSSYPTPESWATDADNGPSSVLVDRAKPGGGVDRAKTAAAHLQPIKKILAPRRIVQPHHALWPPCRALERRTRELLEQRFGGRAVD